MTKDDFGLLNEGEAVALIVETACKLLEFQTPEQLWYLRHFHGLRGPDPINFHPTSGDRMLLRHLALDLLFTVPPSQWTRINCRFWGHFILVDGWYPIYGTGHTDTAW